MEVDLIRGIIQRASYEGRQTSLSWREWHAVAVKSVQKSGCLASMTHHSRTLWRRRGVGYPARRMPTRMQTRIDRASSQIRRLAHWESISSLSSMSRIGLPGKDSERVNKD